MRQVSFKQVDVFTAERFRGNPVAVVLQADGLTDAQMQQIAHWTNLSETTFVVPVTDPSADYRVRIFTPGAELPFAGHPTIGTAHALIEAGLVRPTEGVLVQECAAGLVRLEVHEAQPGEQRIAFELPQARITPLTAAEVEALEAALGAPVAGTCAPLLVNVGPGWIVAQLGSADSVLANQPDQAALKALTLQANATGVIIFGRYPQGAPATVEVRAYAPACGVEEDPVCGSGNGAMAAFIRHTGQTARFADSQAGSFVASQGARVNRAGVIHLSISDEAISVGGQAITCIDGLIRF